MAATPIKIFPKDPAEVLDYGVRWRRWLKGDTIGAIPTVTPDAGIIVSSIVFGGDTVVIWASGGIDGTTYFVTVQIVTTGGRTGKRTIAFRVASR